MSTEVKWGVRRIMREKGRAGVEGNVNKASKVHDRWKNKRSNESSRV